MSGMLVAGCGDDDPQPTPDASVTPDGGGSDGGTDAGGDASVEPLTLHQVHTGLVSGATDLRGLIYASDGKIYASGMTVVEGDAHVTVVRFLADGALDTTFGQGGFARRNLIAVADDTAASGQGSEHSFGVRELADGALLVVANVNDGAGGQNVALLKFDDEGTFDADFGVVTVDFGWTDADNASFPTAPARPVDLAWDLVLDKSVMPWRAVIFGIGPAPRGALNASDEQRTDNDRYVVRVRVSDGAVDTDFATNGRHAFDFEGLNLGDNLRRGMVEDDGSIVSAGYVNLGAGLNNHVVLLRLDADGTPDTDFGFGTEEPGATKVNPFLANSQAGMAEAYAVAKQSTGRYVTTGYGDTWWENTETRARDLVTFGVLADRLDPAYGTGGTFVIQSERYGTAGQPSEGRTPNRENGRDLVLLADDRAVHVGCYDDYAAFFLLSANGALDDSFDEDGMLVYSNHGLPFHKAAASADGRRIAALTEGNASRSLSPFLAILEVRGGE